MILAKFLDRNGVHDGEDPLALPRFEPVVRKHVPPSSFSFRDYVNDAGPAIPIITYKLIGQDSRGHYLYKEQP